MEIRCPSCNKKAGETNLKSFVKITCQRCFKDFTVTKGVYEILPTDNVAQRKKQERYDAKKKMSQASHQSRISLRRK